MSGDALILQQITKVINTILQFRNLRAETHTNKIIFNTEMEMENARHERCMQRLLGIMNAVLVKQRNTAQNELATGALNSSHIYMHLYTYVCMSMCVTNIYE